MFDKAADACLPVLKIVPDWIALNKTVEKFDNVVFCNGDLDFDY